MIGSRSNGPFMDHLLLFCIHFPLPSSVFFYLLDSTTLGNVTDSARRKKRRTIYEIVLRFENAVVVLVIIFLCNALYGIRFRVLFPLYIGGRKYIYIFFYFNRRRKLSIVWLALVIRSL